MPVSYPLLLPLEWTWVQMLGGLGSSHPCPRVAAPLHVLRWVGSAQPCTRAHISRASWLMLQSLGGHLWSVDWAAGHGKGNWRPYLPVAGQSAPLRIWLKLTKVSCEKFPYKDIPDFIHVQGLMDSSEANVWTTCGLALLTFPASSQYLSHHAAGLLNCCSPSLNAFSPMLP